jgi:putative proteasome-type protease
MMADTRANTGIDNISTYRKLHIFGRPGEFLAAQAAVGNLSMTQSIVSHQREGLKNPETGNKERLVGQNRNT